MPITAKPKKTLFLICLTSLLLSGCSPNQIFQQLVRTDEEQAAEATIQNATKFEQLRATLNAKSKSYTLAAPLSPLKETGETPSLIYAYFQSDPDKPTVYEIEGLLPPPQFQYLVWATNDAQTTFLKLGTLTLNSESHYQLTSSVNDSAANLTSVVVSDDEIADTKPLNPAYASKLISVTNPQPNK